jgi:hypothetical protein
MGSDSSGKREGARAAEEGKGASGLCGLAVQARLCSDALQEASRASKQEAEKERKRKVEEQKQESKRKVEEQKQESKRKAKVRPAFADGLLCRRDYV